METPKATGHLLQIHWTALLLVDAEEIAGKTKSAAVFDVVSYQESGFYCDYKPHGLWRQYLEERIPHTAMALRSRKGCKVFDRAVDMTFPPQRLPSKLFCEKLVFTALNLPCYGFSVPFDWNVCVHMKWSLETAGYGWCKEGGGKEDFIHASSFSLFLSPKPSVPGAVAMEASATRGKCVSARMVSMAHTVRKVLSY